MKKILLPLLLMTFIITSCSKDPISSSDVENGDGKISLTFNKSTIPSEIVKIKATLSRTNFETISKAILIGQDSIISIDINSIPSGDWNLEVLAYDQSDIVKYKGSKDVIIMNDYTSEVYLTLDPAGQTSQGYGNIRIYIKWGDGSVNQSGWYKYEGNPISFNNSNIYIYPAVIKDDNNYKMYLTDVGNSAFGNIHLTTSLDGLNWSDPIKVLSPSFLWDAICNSSACVVKVNGSYKMYFTAYDNANSDWNIGLATSTDGINWTKKSRPILSVPLNSNQRYISNSIIFNDGVYHLYLTHYSGNRFVILEATSRDGEVFQINNVPLITNSLSWESTGIYAPSVVHFDGKYHMVYSNVDASAFGYATSTDGKNWIKDTNPIHTLTNETNLRGYEIAYPKLAVVNNKLTVFYSTIYNSSVYNLNILLKK